MDIIQKTKKEIQDLKKIQGATQVAKAVVFALNKYGQNLKTKDKQKFIKQLKKASEILQSARPTEPLSQNGVKFIFHRLRKEKDITQAKTNLQKATKEFLALIERTTKDISFKASKIIKNNENIFTHCHSSVVEESFKQAKKQGRKFRVFNTETRPLFQGHITAKNLLKAGIPVTMVVDSSAGFLISRYSGKRLMMDKVIIGCDAILPDGSIINKIGSFGISVVAFEEKVPVYIIASLLKFHPKSWITIEERSPKEVWKNAPKNLKIINFAFDIVPAKYITGIICEAGLIKPKEVQKEIREIYPWLI